MIQPFNSLDVETANYSQGSICQIGIAHFCNGSVVDSWVTLVNPETYFSRKNIHVHGISPSMVAGMPEFPEIFSEIKERTSSLPTVCHTLFDKVAIEEAIKIHDLENIHVEWVDSCRLARIAWSNKRLDGGYGLRNLCNWLEIEFNHHDALEDAIAAGKVAIAACSKLGMSLSEYSHKTNRIDSA